MAKKYSQTSNTRFDDPVAIKREFELRMKENSALQKQIDALKAPKTNGTIPSVVNNITTVNVQDYAAQMHIINTNLPANTYEEIINRNTNIVSATRLPGINNYDGWIPFGTRYDIDGDNEDFEYIKEKTGRNWLRFRPDFKVYEYNPVGTGLKERKWMIFHPNTAYTTGNARNTFDIHAKVNLSLDLYPPLSTGPIDSYFIRAMMVCVVSPDGLVSGDDFDTRYDFYNASIYQLAGSGVNTNNHHCYAILDERCYIAGQTVVYNTEGIWQPVWKCDNRITLEGSTLVCLKQPSEVVTIWYKIIAFPIAHGIAFGYEWGNWEATHPDTQQFVGWIRERSERLDVVSVNTSLPLVATITTNKEIIHNIQGFDNNYLPMV